MGERTGSRIILTGFSTTGKSVVGREVARRLGWDFADIDEEIVRHAGRGIPEIFADEGEAGFRRREKKVIRSTLRPEKRVIATGGGAVLDPDNLELFHGSGMVLCLEARPETIHRRLTRDIEKSGHPAVRPLLEVEDPLERIRSLKAARQSYYALADFTIHTDDLTPGQVVTEALRDWQLWEGWDNLAAPVGGPAPACEVVTITERYPVYVGWGLREGLAGLLSRAGLSGVANIISDETVFSLYGGEIETRLRQAGYKVNSLSLPPGEASKSLAGASKIYDFLVEKRVERGDFILALGGGVIGDLAGFAAATFLRGVALVHLPTSLVAMVDASIGGKVAINHPEGKNLIGAFYQPRLVAADVQTLTTLPRREFVSGWSEVVKHGLILDAGLVDFLEEKVAPLLEMEPEALTEAIARSAAVKARVVSQDEKEAGIRTLLNYGHTIAHGLEAAGSYQGLLHGESVAIGMVGAGMISQGLGLLPDDKVRRQHRLLQRFGLPVSAAGIDKGAVLRAMELDKKIRRKAIRWVLLTDIGRAVIRDDVSPPLAAETVDRLLGG